MCSSQGPNSVLSTGVPHMELATIYKAPIEMVNAVRSNNADHMLLLGGGRTESYFCSSK